MGRKTFPLWLFLLGCFARPVDRGDGAHTFPVPPIAIPDSAFAWQWIDPRRENIELFWKDDTGGILGSLGNLKAMVESRGDTLVAAMNGGMFDTGWTAHGLFVQAGRLVRPLDTTEGVGNFYLKPNGVFFLDTSGRAGISTTDRFRLDGGIFLATQSGPMLVVDSAIHPAFMIDSRSLNIRNGVGIGRDGRVLLAISRSPVNFHAFASFFVRKGCAQALYLDGAVSRAWLPSADWIQTDGEFGVMIGVVRKRKALADLSPTAPR